MILLKNSSEIVTLIRQGDIKSISVDLWNTLILENPNIYKQRINILNEYHSDTNYWKRQFCIEARIEERKNRRGEVTPAAERIEWIISEHISSVYRQEIMNRLQEVVIHYLPNINSSMISNVKEWRTMGIPICILSNTGKTSSETILRILEKLEIKNLFSQILFSEKYRFGKPSKDFFDLISLKTQTPIQNICHIGDHVYYDCLGAYLSEIGYFCFPDDIETL